MPESFCSTGTVVLPPSRENVTAGEPVTLVHDGNSGGGATARRCDASIVVRSSVVIIVSPAREGGIWVGGRYAASGNHPLRTTHPPRSRPLGRDHLTIRTLMASILTTARLRLVPIPLECTTSPPEAREPIARACDADVPEAWPVEHYDQEALDYTRKIGRAS